MSAEACWLEGDNQCHLTLQRYTKGECHQIQSPPLKKTRTLKCKKKVFVALKQLQDFGESVTENPNKEMFDRPKLQNPLTAHRGKNSSIKTGARNLSCLLRLL